MVPAGTANLFATNLGIPKDIDGAVAVEGLDQAGVARVLQAAIQLVTRLQDALGEIGA